MNRKSFKSHCQGFEACFYEVMTNKNSQLCDNS